VCGYVPDTVLVLRTAKDLEVTFPIVSEYAIMGPEFLNLAGELAEGIVSTSSKPNIRYDLPDSDPQKKVCIGLYEKYTAKYGTFSSMSTLGWDSWYLILEALKKVDAKLDPTKGEDLKLIRAQIRDNLEKIQGFVGTDGVFSYSADNHNGLSLGCYVPVVVKEGQWRLYTRK
jgi:branched-chain amino acid transport system substrate-binding protein